MDGRLCRTLLAGDSSLSHSELLSPPKSKDYKHGLAVAAIDAVQLAVIGLLNDGMIQSAFCGLTYISLRSSFSKTKLSKPSTN